MRVASLWVISCALAIAACGRQALPEVSGVDETGTPTPVGTDSQPQASPTPVDETDTGFGTDGRVGMSGNGSSQAGRAALTADGDVVVAGAITQDSIHDDTVLAQFAGDTGAIDTAFASNGWRVSDLGKNASTGKSYDDYAAAVAIAPGGNIWVAGVKVRDGNGDYDPTLARFSPSGALDTTLGSNGVLTFAGFSLANAVAIVPDPDGSVWVGIDGYAGNAHAWGVAHVLATGKLDSQFAATGVRIMPIDPAFQTAVLADLVRVPAVNDSPAGVVLAGRVHDAAVLTKLDLHGNVDGSFGQNGSRTISLSSPIDVASLSVDAAHNLLLCTNFDNSVAVFRTDYDGGLDGSFGTLGMALIDIPGGATPLAARALTRNDGRIDVAISANGLGVFRLLPDGATDGSWGDSGWATTTQPRTSDRARDLLELIDGRVIAVGTNVNDPGSFVLAAFKKP